MLTIKNMMTAAKDNLRDAKLVYIGSSTAYVTALRAYRYAAMAVGGAQSPYDEETVAKATTLMYEAEHLMQASVVEQIDMDDPPPARVSGVLDMLSGLLCAAFEGGSNYWYSIERYEFPEGVEYKDFQEGGSLTNPGTYWHPSQLIPLHPGCAVIITDTVQGGEHKLDREKLNKGLGMMASLHRRHFDDLISGQDDADTGDVFLQCCLFGDVYYG